MNIEKTIVNAAGTAMVVGLGLFVVGSLYHSPKLKYIAGFFLLGGVTISCLPLMFLGVLFAARKIRKK
jgi:hypothetical protein